MPLVTAVEVFDAPDVPAGSGAGCGAAFVWMHYLDDADDPEFNGFLRGRLTGLSEAQLSAGVPVTVQPGGLRANLDRFGRFDFGAIPAARYEVEIGVPDVGAWKGEAMVRAGGVVDMSIEVGTRPDTVRAAAAPAEPNARATVSGAASETAPETAMDAKAIQQGGTDPEKTQELELRSPPRVRDQRGVYRSAVGCRFPARAPEARAKSAT
jgi:hypothetical protein